MSNKLCNIMRADLSYNEDGKSAFHTEGKKVLRALAKEMGLQKGEYEVRSNQGGIAVSGEVTLHADRFYLQLSQGCLGPGAEILLRSCQGQKDYTGGRNNFLPVSALNDPSEMAQIIRRVQRPLDIQGSIPTP